MTTARRAAWYGAPIMHLRARALHAVWNEAPGDETPRFAQAAARVMEWTLEALAHDEQRETTKAVARWKRA